jgi:hypothetical protein
MEGATPARLYATLVGSALAIAGIAGFFYASSFGTPGDVGDMFGAFAVNGWYNVFHILVGTTGLLAAGYAARQYALWLGIAFVGLAVWGFVIGVGSAILGLVPVDTADNVLHLALGLLGVGAAIASPVDGAGRPAPA